MGMSDGSDSDSSSSSSSSDDDDDDDDDEAKKGGRLSKAEFRARVRAAANPNSSTAANQPPLPLFGMLPPMPAFPFGAGGTALSVSTAAMVAPNRKRKQPAGAAVAVPGMLGSGHQVGGGATDEDEDEEDDDEEETAELRAVRLEVERNRAEILRRFAAVKSSDAASTALVAAASANQHVSSSSSSSSFASSSSLSSSSSSASESSSSSATTAAARLEYDQRFTTRIDTKYWNQRYSLFSLFDHGCLLDTVGWYSGMRARLLCSDSLI